MTTPACLPQVRQVLPAGSWRDADKTDHVALEYHERHRRRHRYRSAGGLDFLLDLPRAVVLAAGDGLLLDDGRLIEVQAAEEALIEVRAGDPQTLMRLAWHIGNRHLPAQFLGGVIRLREDHVIAAMLQGLGAELRSVQEPFTPESGAYAGGHGHSHPLILLDGHAP